mmetsp:Transcript_9807/g.17189  ORF Transcript_9807/g.17189 Transcript_9807/m.17189 type:complete len:253 (-) Transcript_9807:123-881(-)|eukprot:CAMPEP_0183705028 /NCGR_PEP_ID=MMETSP0737-20130205/2214_1 /TAXON_ID=385413 /ORGANISM="Thalassiosira miniscula, Strain CCMP1093" /LENGTH=252 /DNA_ID=CAMNT_0025932083 /DNA_START=16 /DNA_END=774 /DNA_ORIENTATION=-
MTNDWRETLFVWDGIASVVQSEGKENKDGNDLADNGKDDPTEKSDDLQLKWQGTWVGCESADATKVPTPKRGAFNEFVTSENTFEVEGIATKRTTVDGEKKETNAKKVGGDISSLYRVAMTGGSGYELDEGSDKKKHKDDRHDIYFFSPTLRWMGNLRDQVENMVLAIGENEYGKFISTGWLRVGNRVTLARRYLDDDDERAKWDIEDLREAVFGQIATMADDGHVNIIIPPWQCGAMHAKSVSKRQKIANE